MNQFVEDIAHLAFADFLPLELERAPATDKVSADEFILTSPWKSSTAYPYRLSREEVRAMKLIQPHNLVGGPVHDLYFRLNVKRVANAFATTGAGPGSSTLSGRVR